MSKSPSSPPQSWHTFVGYASSIISLQNCLQISIFDPTTPISALFNVKFSNIKHYLTPTFFKLTILGVGGK